MNKQTIRIERELKSNSLPIIWNIISTPEGLSKWLADEVSQDENKLIFTWGKSWSHHETKTATIGETVKNSHFRFHWDSEEDRNTFVELRIERGELTNDHILIITDHAEIEDVDFLEGFWEDNLDRLHRTCGL